VVVAGAEVGVARFAVSLLPAKGIAAAPRCTPLVYKGFAKPMKVVSVMKNKFFMTERQGGKKA